MSVKILSHPGHGISKCCTKAVGLEVLRDVSPLIWKAPSVQSAGTEDALNCLCTAFRNVK